ncbi:hypothetical protein LPTSP2_39380 [Leptospira ellinghausenii]|uniref:Uncharacterized protein n=1 Tax=Leptospira ellinghausenii TaxID=1917822 RepID=A0A2P2DJ31_9LEPT|nr:hypothetical protein [Leptospira ellinghausenii]GBF44635.1 hypothetical protein LPTSP2_39380 [Leptospira ellinghausenii]
MTAIFSYLTKSPKIAVLATDNIFTSKNGNTKGDKIFYLFNRFYISPAGPNILPSALLILYDYQKFDNSIKPTSMVEFFSMIQSIYDLKLADYTIDSDPQYRDSRKIQTAIIYDSLEHEMYHISFGQPFSKNEWEKEQKFSIIPEGFFRDGLYNQYSSTLFPNPDFNSDFIEMERYIENEFIELNKKTSVNFSINIGNIGSKLFVNEEKKIFSSTFNNYTELLENR